MRFQETTKRTKNWFMLEKTLLERSHVPFSGQGSACLIEGKKGFLYPGVRLEISSFPISISSVQAAVCSCLANQDEPISVKWFGNKPELFDFWCDLFRLSEMKKQAESLSLYDPMISTSDPDILLQTLLDFAVTPASDFPVSALLEIHVNDQTAWVPGVNVEPGPWSLGLCAERVAVSRALSAGYDPSGIMKIHAPKAEFSSPCGACRQVLFETMPNYDLELFHGDGSRSRHTVFDLLPMSFLSTSLQKELRENKPDHS